MQQFIVEQSPVFQLLFFLNSRQCIQCSQYSIKNAITIYTLQLNTVNTFRIKTILVIVVYIYLCCYYYLLLYHTQTEYLLPYLKWLLFNRRQAKMHSYLQPLSGPNTPKFTSTPASKNDAPLWLESILEEKKDALEIN